MRVRLHPEADEEIGIAAQWYEDREARLGDRFLEATVAALFEIEKYPHRFPPHTHIRSARDIRRCSISRFPYAVIYEVKSKYIEVVAVAHSARKPGYWINRLG